MKPLATELGGDERSLARSFGLELTELREYQAGDDVRSIDWNTTARSDRTYVREAYVERALDVWLLVDVSASIDWGTAECLKRHRALELAGIAGHLLSRDSNRVGAMLFADRPLSFVPPGSGRNHLIGLLEGLQAEPPQNRCAATDLAGALERAASILRRRSLVLVVSDFLVPEGWQMTLLKLARRHEVVAVRLRDPREMALPDVGLVTLEDPETGAQLLVDTSDAGLRDRFVRAAQEQHDRLRRELAAFGVDLLTLSTGEPLLSAMVRFLSARHTVRRAAQAIPSGSMPTVREAAWGEMK